MSYLVFVMYLVSFNHSIEFVINKPGYQLFNLLLCPSEENTFVQIFNPCHYWRDCFRYIPNLSTYSKLINLNFIRRYQKTMGFKLRLLEPRLKHFYLIIIIIISPFLPSHYCVTIGLIYLSYL